VTRKEREQIEQLVDAWERAGDEQAKDARRTKEGELDAALKQFKLAETALEEFNATYPKGSET